MDPLKMSPQQETKLHFLDYWRIIRIRKTVILAVFLLVVITATLVTYMYPESYASSARIKIEGNHPDRPGVNESQVPDGYDPYFIQTEFEVIQSEVVLTKVIEALDLNDAWGKKYNGGQKFKTPETILFLKGHIVLRPVRNTKLIEIQVFSDNRDEAAALANKVAEVYQQYRLDQLRSISLNSIKTLQEQYNDLEQQILAQQKEVDRLRDELQIPDALINSDGPATLMSGETLRHLESLRIENKTKYVQQSTLLDELKPLNHDQLRATLPTTYPDPQLTDLLSQLNLADQKLIALEKDISTNHPVYLNQKKDVDYLNRQIDERVDGIMASLQRQTDSAKAALDALTAEVDRATHTDIETAAKSGPYFAAKRKLDELQSFRKMLNLKIESEGVDVSLPHVNMVEIVDRAQPGTHPVRPNKPLNITLGILIGLIVGVGLAFFIEYLDTSVKTIDDVERTLQAPVLGVIPQNVGLILTEGAESPHAEAYRVLRTNLMFSRKDDKLNTICIVSAGAGEGKSTTVLNLATVFAQNGNRVLIVDSDLRRPTLHKMLRVSNSLGLTNYLLKQNSLEQVIQTSSVSTLDFMASGKLPSSSLGILSSTQMKDLITELKQRYDFVFFDSPPIMGVSDASVLASEVDMTLQVIQYRRYPQPMNIRAKQMIEKVGGNLVGIVLNNINMSQDESYYYYSGYYHDYYSRNEEDIAPEPKTEVAPADDKPKLDIKQKY